MDIFQVTEETETYVEALFLTSNSCGVGYEQLLEKILSIWTTWILWCVPCVIWIPWWI